MAQSCCHVVLGCVSPSMNVVCTRTRIQPTAYTQTHTHTHAHKHARARTQPASPTPTPAHTRAHTHTHSCACKTCYKDASSIAAGPGRACVLSLGKLQARRWVRAGTVSAIPASKHLLATPVLGAQHKQRERCLEFCERIQFLLHPCLHTHTHTHTHTHAHTHSLSASACRWAATRAAPSTTCSP